MTGERVRLRFVAPLRPKTPPRALTGEIAFLPMEAIGDDGTYDSRSVRLAADVEGSGYTYFEEGDVVRARVTPCFENGKGALLSTLTGGRGLGTTELFAFNPSRRIDARFLYYVTASEEFTKQGAATLYGAHGVRRVDDQFARDYRVWAPPIPTQRAVADYLDRETARIDALISAKRRMVAVLDEQFSSRRERLLVTEGAVKWIPLHHLTDPLRPIVYGIVQAGEEFPGGIPYIKTGDLPELDPTNLSRTSPEIDRAYRRARVVPGDIVVAMRASIGTAVLVPQGLPTANLTQGTARVAPRKGVEARWLLHAFRTRAVQEQCSVRAVGTTFKTLNIWDLRRVRVPTPSPEHRSSLADKVNEAAAHRDQMCAVLARQIELLHERRAALITSAVTGQLDFPEAA